MSKAKPKLALKVSKSRTATVTVKVAGNPAKVSGKVTGFQWANPHVYIEMDGKNVKDEKAQVQHYTVECASPGILTRIGWKFNMVKPGDEITVIIAPLRTGEPGGLLKQVTLPDGRKFLNGGPAGKPNIE